jgi:hypothetical protein
VRFYLKKKKKYPSQKRAGGVAQGVGLKVKLQYSKKKIPKNINQFKISKGLEQKIYKRHTKICPSLNITEMQVNTKMK